MGYVDHSISVWGQNEIRAARTDRDYALEKLRRTEVELAQSRRQLVISRRHYQDQLARTQAANRRLAWAAQCTEVMWSGGPLAVAVIEAARARRAAYAALDARMGADWRTLTVEEANVLQARIDAANEAETAALAAYDKAGEH